jgi:hypothetical protein
MQQPAPTALGAGWTLKQVQGDEWEGEVRGWEIVAEGTPEQVVKEPRSFMGQYLAPLLVK